MQCYYELTIKFKIKLLNPTKQPKTTKNEYNNLPAILPHPAATLAIESSLCRWMDQRDRGMSQQDTTNQKWKLKMRTLCLCLRAVMGWGV